MSVEVIWKVFQATEEDFLSVATRQWPTKPQIAAVGSCFLVRVICSGTLYIANLGDSRAVLGRLVRSTGEVLIESVRKEMQSLHPDYSQIVVLKHNVWRVKGLIQQLRRRRFSTSPRQFFIFPYECNDELNDDQE
ncbi:putative protein phosphatase 2C 46 [Capsicum baccatum]|uniref:PPM-type phosphatase domain-containing protein n=1 Tax=Capsicum baccatum TaxID=33114 RepID=A0A2G2X2B2_CAPBA|nr:putative protein phosphatase 2C 46 [Capsicum baccatum]